MATAFAAAILIGADGEPEPLFDLIAKLLEGSDLEMGANRHGQLMVSRESVTAAGVVTFDAQTDILDGEFETDIDREIRCNNVEYFYGRRYVSPTAPRDTPTTGQPLPTQPVAPYADWESGLKPLPDTSASNAVGRVITRKLENYVIRVAATADLIADRVLKRGVGPAPAKDGPRIATIPTGWQGVVKSGTMVELGTVIKVEHPEGLSASGWTSAAPARVRTRTIRISPQTGRVTLHGRVLEEETEMTVLFMPLGGSRRVALPQVAADQKIVEYIDIVIPNLSTAVLANAKVRADCKVADAATSVTPKLIKIVGGVADATVATGSACTATDDEYNSANQKQVITPSTALVAGATYRGYGLPSNTTHPTFVLMWLDIFS